MIIKTGLWLMVGMGIAQADDLTFIATGTINYPSASPTGQSLKIGDIMQLEYTIDPSMTRTAVNGIFEGGPVVALSYSFNGSPFTDFYGNVYADEAHVDGNSYSWDLQPSHGTEAYVNVSTGQMALRNINLDGGQADITDIKQLSPMSAPEIESTSAASALTLLLGGLAVLRGRREKNAA